jgi:hypothetical protein
MKMPMRLIFSGIRGEDRGARTHGRLAGARDRVLKGALRNAPRPRSATTSVITGPMASPSPKDAV